MSKLLTLSFMLGFFALAAGAVSAAVVVDQSGHPLEGASIATDYSGVGAVTDEAGAFTLPQGAGATKITVSCVGYQPLRFTVPPLPDTVVLAPAFYREGDVVVRADRFAGAGSAVAIDNISQADIERDYSIGELPLLLSSATNVYAFADGGTSLGYSYMKVRGFDDKRVATYINGVPLNDPEWQSTYFVDLPDFAANVTDIQVQRGVGNSLYGDASFGGTVNIATSGLTQGRKTSFTLGYGEYTADGSGVGGIYKQSLEYSSGLIDGRWHYTGRFSKQRTDGYRHNSWYEGWAYFFSLARLDPGMTTELYVYGGPMKMHLAYSGASRDLLEEDRRVNPYHTYANETDNFNQPHYHLHNTFRLNERATVSNTLYFIRGKGYWEQKIVGASFADYAIASELTGGATSGDLVRRLWVEKYQVGWNPRVDVEHSKGTHSMGGSFYHFRSDHWGQVVWATPLTGSIDPQHRYNQYTGSKQVASLFAQEQWRLADRWRLDATAQIRYQRYEMDQSALGAFSDYDYVVDWLFFSPRVAIDYFLSDRITLRGLIAISSRTPAEPSIYDAEDPHAVPSLEIDEILVSSNQDTTFAFGDPTATSERVYDFEVGGSYRYNRVNLSANLYWMEFRNEIIPSGSINPNTGYAITINADRSVHAGLELSGGVKASPYLTIEGNYAFNYNRVKEYVGEIDVWLPDWSSSYRSTLDYADKRIAGFPDHLANLMFDFDYRQIGTVLRLQYAGQQFVELYNVDSLAIDAHVTASVGVSYALGELPGVGAAELLLRVENLFDRKYESSGYGWTYGVGEVDGPVTLMHGGEYYVAPERSFYAQVKVDLF